MNRTIFTIALLLFATLVRAEQTRYERAQELYKQGPSKGEEIVSLLRDHLAEFPDDTEATKLLAITLFGIEKFDEAIPVIDRAIELADVQNTINPKMVMLKARSLFHLGRYSESRQLLEAYWAFWQQNPKLKELYDYYYPRTLEAERAKEGEPAATDNPDSAQ